MTVTGTRRVRPLWGSTSGATEVNLTSERAVRGGQLGVNHGHRAGGELT